MSEKKGEKKYMEYKIILIGNSAVGKTAFFKKITKGVFNERHISTIGVDKSTLYFKDIEVKSKDVEKKEEFNIILFDTAGQDRYRSLAKSYFNSTDIVMLIYDITNKQSFIDIEKWLDDIQDKLSDWKTGHYVIFLLGNKLDLANEDGDGNKREVTEEEAESICEEKSIYWGGECSCKTFTQEQLNEILLKSFKKYVENFGIKEDPKKATRLGDLKKKRFMLRIKI